MHSECTVAGPGEYFFARTHMPVFKLCTIVPLYICISVYMYLLPISKDQAPSQSETIARHEPFQTCTHTGARVRLNACMRHGKAL